MPDRLPMFPLNNVLFPHSLLPLQVFETRYLHLLRDCLAGRPEFGVVLIERGFEVGGGDTRFSVGTVARIVHVVEVADGPLGVFAVGQRKIEVVQWLPDDPYPLALVEVVEEEADGDPVTVDRVRGSLQRLLGLYSELGADVAGISLELADDPGVASYQAAARAPLGPLDAQLLLEATSPARRLQLLETVLDEQATLVEARLSGR